MGNPYYGLSTALSDVSKGYEQEEGRVAAQERGAQDTEKRTLELEKMRAAGGQEKSKSAIRKLLQGDMEGAMELLGDYNMTDLALDRDSNVVSWLDADGKENAMALPHLMASVGMDPKDLDTPEAKLGREKELVTHKAQEAKKYGIGTAGGRPTAYIQNLEYTMKKLTGGDARKAFQLMQLSKSDPQAAYSRILIGLQKQNKDAFDEEKMSEKDMRKAAKDAVTGFRQEMFDELLGKQEQPGQPPTTTTAPALGQTEQPFDPNNPSSLWR